MAASARYSLRNLDIQRSYIAYGDVSAEKNAVDLVVKDQVLRGKVTKISPDSIQKNGTAVNWSDQKAVRRHIRNILQQFLGKSVSFSHDGALAEAYLTSRGIDHSVVGLNEPEKAAAFSEFHQLIQNAEYAFSSQNDPHSNSGNSVPGGIDWDVFVSTAMINDRPYPVIFKIRSIDSDTRSQIYRMATKKEIGSTRDHGQQKPDKMSSYGVTPISEETISQEAVSGQEENKRFSVRYAERDSIHYGVTSVKPSVSNCPLDSCI